MLYAHVETIELAQASWSRRRSGLRTTPAKSRRAAASRFAKAATREPFHGRCCGHNGKQGRCGGRAASCRRQRYSSRPKEEAGCPRKRSSRPQTKATTSRRIAAARSRTSRLRKRKTRATTSRHIAAAHKFGLPPDTEPREPCSGARVLLEDLFERRQKLGRRRGVAVFVIASPVEFFRNPRDHGELAVSGEGSLGAARAPEQVEGYRSLIGEQAEELHLSEGETRVARAVEHLEHTECTLVVQERNCHQPFRNEPGALGGLAREARVGQHVFDHERLAADEDEPGDPRARREPAADKLIGAFTGDGFEHELVRLLVEQEDRGGLRAEDRPGDLHDRLQQLGVVLLRSERAGRNRAAKVVGHDSPPTLEEVR